MLFQVRWRLCKNCKWRILTNCTKNWEVCTAISCYTCFMGAFERLDQCQSLRNGLPFETLPLGRRDSKSVLIWFGWSKRWLQEALRMAQLKFWRSLYLWLGVLDMNFQFWHCAFVTKLNISLYMYVGLLFAASMCDWQCCCSYLCVCELVYMSCVACLRCAEVKLRGHPVIFTRWTSCFEAK